MRVRFAAWAALLVLPVAGAVQAQTTAPIIQPAAAAPASPKLSWLDQSLTQDSAGFTGAESDALSPGVVRTAVDHRFADRLIGSMGFLCGLHPSVGHEGAEAMRGSDPDGKFLGAKLSLAFR
ncbi:MAG TPA: hypothetical protein VIJ94_07735 [Caulobacteraceae bacterium]